MPRGQKKQQAWGYRVARLFREVNRRVTYALGWLEAKGCGEFPENYKSLINIVKYSGLSLNPNRCMADAGQVVSHASRFRHRRGTGSLTRLADHPLHVVGSACQLGYGFGYLSPVVAPGMCYGIYSRAGTSTELRWEVKRARRVE